MASCRSESVTSPPPRFVSTVAWRPLDGLFPTVFVGAPPRRPRDVMFSDLPRISFRHESGRMKGEGVMDDNMKFGVPVAIGMIIGIVSEP